MMTPKWLVSMTKNFTAKKKKNITTAASASAAAAAKEEHVVVYSRDEKRFELALKYMGSIVILELVRMSAEMDGSAVGGNNGISCIRLPCESSALEYVISFFDKHDGHVDEDTQKALLSIFTSNIDHTATSSSSITAS
ncbi:hypothetical protein CsatA_027748 [Cannabis sativa]